jgi:hypothetical protein
MKPRYEAMAKPPRAWVSATNIPEPLPTITVWAQDDSPRETGLVTAQGVPIYRVQDREPIGFKP